ncbi:hypothetical protein CDD82_148 [Ophiocordyceps australis]|uniref:DNA 3'-5' helicase n=1 Tax=Ophiocordyceps australis TaxID=1399860 RepID=A0A2C5ZIB8_9HYPO|nr:hypothetical protein CDD82_148 [Ophiocordyceps australis]
MASTDPHVASTLQTLNEAQRRAVTSDASTVAILAGPGSGKTHTLTSRVVWLVRHAGYRPSDLIVATFTVKAATEMRKRIAKILGEASEKNIVLGTFHSIARRYLATYGTRIGIDPRFDIADSDDSRLIIERICKQLKLQIEPLHARAWISKRKSQGTKSAARQNRKQIPENPALIKCLDEYQAALARSNLLDYDDLLVRCVELLETHGSCVSNVQAVLVDEFQDTNGIQYELMKLFAQAQQRITIVGDPDQSIYGWRSAEIRNLYRLLREYPGTHEVSLEENYRSSQRILDTSLDVIQQDKKRYKKALLPVHVKGERPVLRTLKSAAAEGEWIVTELRRAVMMLPGILQYQDIAILLRSASLSRHIESALGKAGVPYCMIGGSKFYDRREIKILLDYLRVIYQPDNNEALARILNVPCRGIGEITVKSLLEEARQRQISLWALLCRHCRGHGKMTTNIRPKQEQKLTTELIRIITTLRRKWERMSESSPPPLVDLIEDVVKQLKFQEYLEGKFDKDHEGRWANVLELVKLAGDFVRDADTLDADTLPSVQGVEQAKNDDMLGRFLVNVALASSAQRDDGCQDKTAMVTMSTIHAAKGLEWPIVFVPSVYTGSIPHSRSQDLDEERRLLYVAMTRAQALLYLSFPLHDQQGSGNRLDLSPFVSPFASRFSLKGPSFDKSVTDGVAKILGKPAPTQKAIYDQLPAMFSPEDDGFPIEPFETSLEGGEWDANSRHYYRAPKRQRLLHSKAHSAKEYDGDEENQSGRWKPEYSTTMDKASEFTMATMPGFVTAGMHKTTLEAAAAKQSSRGATCRRLGGQSSLLNFVRAEPKRQNAKAPPSSAVNSSLVRDSAATARHAQAAATSLLPREPTTDEPKGCIDAQFAGHKLATGRLLARPRSTSHGKDDSSWERACCFSSSPPRESWPPKQQAEKLTQQALQPTTSFHATTFVTATRTSGMRRPKRLGPAPSINRLNKPFKPLTMQRPGR